MDILTASPLKGPGWEAYLRLRSHVAKAQDQVCTLAALIEGMDILKDHDKGSNALQAIMGIAWEKADALNASLDSVNLPKPEPHPE